MNKASHVSQHMTSTINRNTSAGKETVVRLSELHPPGFSIDPGLHTLESLYFQFIKINLEKICSLQHASRLPGICTHSSDRDARERKKYAAVHVRAYERVSSCFGGHLVLRACTFLKADVDKTYLTTYFSLFLIYLRPPSHLVPPGPSVPSTVWSFATAVLPADKRYASSGFTFSQMYGPGWQQTFKASNFSTNPPGPAYLCRHHECCGRLDRKRRQEQARVIRS